MKTQPQILVVDDETIILKTIKKLLSKYNLDIYLSGSPLEAIEIIKREQIDLVLSDQRMPEMDGLALLAQVKELSPSTMCILMSGYSDVDLLVTAINSGSIYQYIPKPWENEKFLKIIFKALEVQIEEVEQNIIFQKMFKNRKWIEALSQTRLTRRSDFLNNIIRRQVVITKELLSEAKALDVNLEAPYQLVLLTVSDDDFIASGLKEANRASLNELVFAINMLPYCMAWSYNEFICIILSGEASVEDVVKKKLITNITEMVTDYCSSNYIIGISNMQQGLMKLNSSYSQAYNAYLAIRGANNANARIAYYEKLGALQLLAKLSGSTETDEFIENILGRLIRYDKEKGTNMIHTLDIYLRTSSMKEAAEVLYIHAKTMIFRKSRIEKILDLSLEDYEVRLSLSIALKLYSIN